MLKTLFTLLISFGLGLILYAQEIKIHSHNDYLQEVPFWEAYANGLNSIEADVLLKNGTLYVAHEEENIHPKRTLASLYLEPIAKAYDLEIRNRQPFQLLIDIKTEAYATLDSIISELQKYPDLWEGNSANPIAKIVISGNRPPPSAYTDYPPFIFFDHQSFGDLEKVNLEKVALISLSFRGFSQWNGKGRLTDKDLEEIKPVIRQAKEWGKPFRFWATPDSKTAWKALHELGVDYINTDHPYPAQTYLSSLSQRLYTTPNLREIYRPTFESDGAQSAIKNVILMIGDGNGMAQISSSLYANGNRLTLAELKKMGWIKTQSEDDFTTDSAAAGTALASGQKVKNRSVGALPDGRPVENLPEYLQKYNFATGIVTTDNVTGATPAAFYAHQPERDDIALIASDLVSSPLNLFIGGGKNDFLRYGKDETQSLMEAGFFLKSSLGEVENATEQKVGYFASHHSMPSVLKGRESFLASATRAALDFLDRKEQPFMLMIEGAYIDGGGHLNHAPTVIEEGLDFDEAIATALAFADRDGATLVIITADHETGGITLPQGNLQENVVEMEFSTKDHTGIPVPVFAYGPHSGEFQGIYENTEIFHKIVMLLEKYLKK
ncbi:alkaline phosphatase [Pleomorphovibrio marinus]|uniref:alkaline phosphatase n=1 Tax=Pleomorphovibrio marinus TaxID=2164132 RepID=UPI000E0B6C08|nr:alkaline phosphatase [Pleomorphovibrio marinus]